ncbi:hypothetical protein JX265_002363 [Neoarthrinium moseri]|uniref:Uncharacterized protein n=1 Tax=Neoarthrinium moseri TaxID=1658444 RepID=A0A9P9WU61_9PEZI|nr:hypothetical protein JX265_002363 [Neoarthrinium moseri]
MPSIIQQLPSAVDYRGQIIAKEATGEWKAVALRSSDDNREALLSSEPCDSEEKAKESLYIKSAEATAVYIKTNGFALLRDLKKGDTDTDDDETASVVSERSASSTAALSVWSSSDEELITPASSSPKGGRPATKVIRKGHKSAKTRQPRDCKGEDSDDNLDAPRCIVSTVRPPGGSRYPAAPSPDCHPPPPPPTYRGVGIMPMQNPPPPPPPGMGGRPFGAGFPNISPPPPPGIRPGGPVRVYDVRLTIRWLHHSEQRVFESCRASIRALQDASLTYIRSHMDAFNNVTPLDHSPNKVWALRANVRQAFFGPEKYDMSGYRGDDLTKLFNVVGKNDIPRFEVEVDYVRPTPPVIVTPSGVFDD